MSAIDPFAALPEPSASRRAFDRAASTFAAASIVHDEARQRLLERLDFMKLDPALVVDVGAGGGAGAAALRDRYPQARVLALDSSLAMAHTAAAQHHGFAIIGGDAERLPLKDGQVDVVFANMLLPWSRPEGVFREAARTMTSGGVFLFATLGPDTLEQLRRAWAAVDDRVHVHAFYDMHDLGDLAVAAGLAEPVVDVDRLELTYRDVDSVIRDLRACGAVNLAVGRRRSLTGPARWGRFVEALERGRRQGRIPMTIELILGHAWAAAESRRALRTRPDEAAVAVADIGFRRRSSP